MYEVNHQKIREEIEEVLKWRANEVLDNGGPFALVSALQNYKSTEQLAIQFGIDISEYRDEINLYTRKIKETIV